MIVVTEPVKITVRVGIKFGVGLILWHKWELTEGKR